MSLAEDLVGRLSFILIVLFALLRARPAIVELFHLSITHAERNPLDQLFMSFELLLMANKWLPIGRMQLLAWVYVCTLFNVFGGIKPHNSFGPSHQLVRIYGLEPSRTC